MQTLNIKNNLDRLKQLAATPTTDFPSPEHELAFQIAMYFNEQYSFWVRSVQKTRLLIGQVEQEFNFVRSTSWGKKQQVRTLMKILFP